MITELLACYKNAYPFKSLFGYKDQLVTTTAHREREGGGEYEADQPEQNSLTHQCFEETGKILINCNGRFTIIKLGD